MSLLLDDRHLGDVVKDAIGSRLDAVLTHDGRGADGVDLEAVED